MVSNQAQSQIMGIILFTCTVVCIAYCSSVYVHSTTTLQEEECVWDGLIPATEVPVAVYKHNDFFTVFFDG